MEALSSLSLDASCPLVNTGTTAAALVRQLVRHGWRHGRIRRRSRGAHGGAKMDDGPNSPPPPQGPRRFTWVGFFPGAAPGGRRGELPRTAGRGHGDLSGATGCSLVIAGTWVDDAQVTVGCRTGSPDETLGPSMRVSFGFIGIGNGAS